MALNKKKLEEKVKNYNKNPKMSKKDDRRAKSRARAVRTGLRKLMEQNSEWVDEYVERQRIIREVGGEQ